MPDRGARTSISNAVREVENTFIEMRDGVRLAARMWLPANADAHPVPAILEYLPYRKRDGTAARDALNHPWFAAHGYAAIRVDMRGSGEADGVLEDEYLALEQRDALDVIDWLCAQPWCDGAIGMMGISWGGFNAMQVAALRPPALKAIVTVCSTDDRYADDIHYKGGCLLGENLGWASTMFAYSSRPPDPALVGDRWREMWRERLDGEPLLVKTWLEHPLRDAYWKHGSVCEDFSKITAATLAVGGWADAYSNAIPRLMAGLTCPRKAIIGPWAHKYPHIAVPEPRMGFLQETLRWWDRWLKGMDTGVENDPDYRVYVMDGMRPSTSYDHRPGRWIGAAHWPPEGHREMRLHLSATGLAGAPGDGSFAVRSPQTTGSACGEFCPMWLGPDFPGDQRHDDEGSLVFDTEPFDRPLEIAGAPTVDLVLTSDCATGFIAVRLCEVWPDGASTRITFGTRNLCHSGDHGEAEPLAPGTPVAVRLQLDDIAYTIPAGNRLRLAVSTAYWPMIWPSAAPATLSLDGSECTVSVPVLGDTETLAGHFAVPETAPPLALETLRPERHTRDIDRDAASGRQTITIVDDFGEARDPTHGLVAGEVAREVYTIDPDDPLSARAETHWTETLSRDGWSVRTETFTTMTCDETQFIIAARLEAYEDDEEFLVRTWSERVPRHFV